MDKYKRSPAPKLIPRASGKLPLYRIQIPPNFKDQLVGATLGNRYWVLAVIGRGGMSVVYKAKTKDTGKIVAVKTLRTQGLTDEALVKRFQREAELLSRLNHPRIVNLHAYGTSSRGQPYFVMDYLQGENLTDVLKRDDHLAPERFQDIFVQVCAAIEHAHRHGAIHRDVKPGNIMLTRQGKTRDYVKVVDFGIAKMAEEAQKLTRMGEVWGSPIYMSPEQCMGAAVDERSDIYSLGIVMYESLTGKVPFLGRNYADTMTKQMTDPPPPFAEIRPDLKIPAGLENIIMKAIAKEPEARYQTLTTMRKDLENAITFSKDDKNVRSAKLERKTGEAARKTSEGELKAPAKEKQKIDLKRADAKKTIDFAEETEKKQTLSKVKSVRASQSQSKLKSRKPTKNRHKKLLLIAAASFLTSAAVILVISHSGQVTRILADIVKALVKGLDDDSTAPITEQNAEDKSSVDKPDAEKTDGLPQEETTNTTDSTGR